MAFPGMGATPLELAEYCSMMEDRHAGFKRSLLEHLSVIYRRYRWSMRPNTGLVVDPHTGKRKGS